MSIKRVLAIIFTLSVLNTIPIYSYASYSFTDSFESKDMSTTNAQGFKWAGNNATSIVTMNPQCGGLSAGTPTAVFNNGVICNGPQVPAGGGDWYAKTGDYSLRFRYAAGVAQSEQDFSLGTALNDIWIAYWIRVPQNFTYPSHEPSNSKFFTLWMDAYADHGTGSTIFVGLWSDGGTGAKVQMSWTNVPNTLNGGHTNIIPFITTSDRGKWMYLVYHFKAQSSPGVNDGVAQMWRKWQGDSNFTQIFSVTNADIPLPTSGTPAGFTAGYLMGWINPTYAQDTEWLMDDFTVSDQPLLKAPNPPTIGP